MRYSNARINITDRRDNLPNKKAHPLDTLLTKICLKIKHYYEQTAFWKVLVFEPRAQRYNFSVFSSIQLLSSRLK